MLFDITELEAGADLRAQVCVIGAGAAGITLAHRLSSKGIDVLLLESGGTELEGDVQALHAGEVGGAPYPPLESVRLRYLGGTTNHWMGQSSLLDPLDFRARDWVPDSGWPISWHEYHRYLDEARAICEIPSGPFRYETAFPARAVAPFPGLPGFEPVLLRFSDPPTRFGERYRADLASAPNVRCCLHATCTRLVADPTGQRIVGAELASLSGRRVRATAERYVLAAGAIESSRLLLASRGASGISIGNAHDRVGRFFMEHPSIDVAEVVMGRHDLTSYLRIADFTFGAERFRRDVRLTPEVQERERILNHSVFLSELDSPSRGTLGERVMDVWDRIRWGTWSEDYDRVAGFRCRIRLEHAPRAESRVTLSDTVDALGVPKARLELRFGELEERTISRVAERFAYALGQMGFGRMRFEPGATLERYVERFAWQDHHFGGTRMHESPRHGVVDANGRVHGTVNLYAAGASVFPTSGQANPTMNLVAFTLRLVDHLAELEK